MTRGSRRGRRPAPGLCWEAVGADCCRPASTLQRNDGGGFAEVATDVTKTRPDQPDGSAQLARCNLHFLGPVLHLDVISWVDHDRRVRSFLHWRCSNKGCEPITAKENARSPKRALTTSLSAR